MTELNQRMSSSGWATIRTESSNIADPVATICHQGKRVHAGFYEWLFSNVF